MACARAPLVSSRPADSIVFLGAPVPARNRVTRVLLVLYAAGSAAIVVPLVLDVPRAGELAGTTSGKILAAAILTLGLGAASAIRDPWRNRIVINMIIAFTALSALAILTRLLFHEEPYAVDPAWIVLPLAVAAPVLFGVFYPTPDGGQTHPPSRSISSGRERSCAACDTPHR
jgi:hypothetical protein